MKFIDATGRLCEGIPLTDEQARQRENLIKYFHENICGNSYHPTFPKDTPKDCETLATDFVTGAIQEVANLKPVSEEEERPDAVPTVHPVPALPASALDDESLSF